MTNPSPGASPFRVDAEQTSSPATDSKPTSSIATTSQPNTAPATDSEHTSRTATVAGQTSSPAAGADRLTQLTDWLYRHRGETAFPFAIVLLVAARPTPGRLLVGLPLIVLGESLRLWAASHIGSHARGRTVRAPRRVISGPYALIPHPLYGGSALVCAGLLTLARAAEPWFTVLVSSAFAMQYGLFIRREEAVLRRREEAVLRNVPPSGSSATHHESGATRHESGATHHESGITTPGPTAARQAGPTGADQPGHTQFPIADRRADSSISLYQPWLSRAGFELEWPTLRTILALLLAILGLALARSSQ